MSKLYITTDCTIDFQKLAAAAFKQLNQEDDLEIELVFVTKRQIKRLNKENRNIREVTDVLSFPMLSGIKGKVLKKDDYKLDVNENGRLFLGSIALCEKIAKKQAKQFGHSIEREIYYLVLHGILHIFGYDHIDSELKDEMRQLEEDILKKINMERETN